jgi:hypothetical protein
MGKKRSFIREKHPFLGDRGFYSRVYYRRVFESTNQVPKIKSEALTWTNGVVDGGASLIISADPNKGWRRSIQ